MCDVLNYYKNSIGRFNSRLVNSSEKNKDEMYYKVLELTPFIPEHRTFIERLHALNFGLTENPVCKVCGVDTKYVGKEDGKEPMFRPTCGAKCMGILKQGITIVRDEEAAKEKRKQTMLEKYGVAYNSQRAEVKPKIGQHNKDPEFREKHSIRLKQNRPDIRYDLLEDREYLYNRLKDISVNQLCKETNISRITMRHILKNHCINLNYFRSSQLELEICDILNQHNIKYDKNDRTKLDGMEIDLYLPEYNIGIECNGLYWHNETKLKNTYHRDKSRLAESKGILLLHFWEHEIINLIKLDIIEGMILYHTNNIKNKIHARKCSISTDKLKIIDFINNNHILSNLDKSKQYYGLEFNGEIVSAISISNYNETSLELDRYCCKNNSIVNGGFNKLLTHAILKNSDKKRIYSYSNDRYSNGEVYIKNGFTLDRKTPPNYFYQNGIVVKSRYSSELNYDDKWAKVFDCGSSLFYKNIN